jgi:hypothetical protein
MNVRTTVKHNSTTKAVGKDVNYAEALHSILVQRKPYGFFHP